jgi:hypothetical protein
MAIKKIVFFCGTPFTKRDYDRFGGEILKKNGFDVWFYDFSPILYPDLYNNCAYPDLYQPQNYFLFLSESEGLKSISELPPDSFAIIIFGFGPASFKIYRSLSKARIPYCPLTNSSLPEDEKQKSSEILSTVNRAIKKIFPLNIDTLKKILYRPQFAPLLGINRPDYCIAASETSFESSKAQYLVGNDTKIIWAHSQDYDIFLKNPSKDLKISGNNAIFLDTQAPMFIGDCLALGIETPITVEKYYPSLCKFFEHVEKQLNIKIEIASHPKSNHSSHPDYYGGRRTIRGSTFEMIKNARFVITHGSTAAQFAILLKKPVVILTTNEYKKCKLSLFTTLIDAFAHSVGKTAINVDEPLNIDWEKELFVDENIYDDHIDCYIKKRGTEELNTWQILTNQLKQL